MPFFEVTSLGELFEAKEDRSYTLKGALAELQKARENRLAAVGVFVFSRQAAPEGLEPLSRWDRDIVVVWDAEDAQSDILFKAAISVARMIAVQDRKVSEEVSADITELQAGSGLSGCESRFIFPMGMPPREL